MYKLNLEPFHKIVSLGKGDDWDRFKITVQLPLANGWFEQVKFNVTRSENFGWDGIVHDMPHKKNDAMYAIFETEVTLETCALYCY